MILVNMECGQVQRGQEVAAQNSSLAELPSKESAGVLVSCRIRAIKVWILAAHEAAVLVK
jgi:hypothetical protein